MTPQAEYDAGTAAALKLMRADIETMVPNMFRGMIPVDKEPALAAAVAKVVIDAAAAVRAKVN